jgi:hypothetical protein
MSTSRGPNVHVTPKRLFELAQVPALVVEPEWNHVQNCEECLEGFIQFVKQIDNAAEDLNPSL